MTTRLATAYGALLLLSGLGLFGNLDNRLLWGDEAETAVLAVSITQSGVPRVDDGRNVIANLRGGLDSNEAGIWTWSPWLDEYLVAGSFLLLGKSTLSARLPFAAIAFLAACALARIAYRRTNRHEVALIALALYATCVPLLLHARQARYYAVLCLAELWLIHGLARCLDTGRSGNESQARWPALAPLHVALALATLFYCNYIVVPGNLLALALLAGFVWQRDARAPRQLILAGVGFAALATPWLLYTSPSGQLGRLGLRHFWSSLVYYTSELHFHFVPWVVLALPLGAYALSRLRGERAPRDASGSREWEAFVWLLLPASLLVYALSPLRFFRYLVPLAPPLILLASTLIVRHVRPRWARALLVVALVSSNVVAITTWPTTSHRLTSAYIDFARSIATDYRERLDDVLQFLEAEALPDQTLWVADPEFPLMFYTDLRIIDARYHRFPETPPDWVFATSASGAANRRPLQLPAGVRTLYSETPLVVTRSARGGSRPDPHAHEWLEVGADERETMQIFRRR